MALATSAAIGIGASADDHGDFLAAHLNVEDGVAIVAGLPGLARAVYGEPGTTLRLRVLEFDAAQRRFSAELA